MRLEQVLTYASEEARVIEVSAVGLRITPEAPLLLLGLVLHLSPDLISKARYHGSLVVWCRYLTTTQCQETPVLLDSATASAVGALR
jgi:hypothetical protein